MCGIFGIILTIPPTRGQIRIVRRLFTEMSYRSVMRGSDAAGFAAIDSSGRATVHRLNKASTTQIQCGIWSRQLLNIGRNTRALMGHTRAATHGANIIMNAHPHVFSHPKHGRLVGTHNGIIWNYQQLYPFDTGKPFENDSANLFAFLSQLPEVEWPNAFSEVDGWYALAMQRANRLYFVRNTAPCYFGMIKELNALVYASSEYIIAESALDTHLNVEQIDSLTANKMVVMDLLGEIKYSFKIVEPVRQFNPAVTLFSGLDYDLEYEAALSQQY